MAKGFLDSLWGVDEEGEGEYKPHMPESGLLTNDFSGKWTCALMYRIWVEDGIDLDTLRLPYNGRQTLTAGSGAFYYWKNSAEGFAAANAACKELDKKYGPNLTWRWEMPMTTILGWQSEKNPVEAFGEFRSEDVDISPMTSRKGRHRYQMIVLPSALQALALNEELLAAPVYDYVTELTKLKEKIEAGTDLHPEMERLIGTENSYAQSELWKARTELWKALGEENPMAYTLDQGKHDFTSKLMRGLMRIVYKKTTLWATLSEVPDPHVEAQTKSGKHMNVFCIKRIYDSREVAVEAVGAEYQGEPAAEVDVTLPQRWHAIEGVTAEDWLVSVREIISKYSLRGKPTAEQKKILAEHAGDLDKVYYASVDEVLDSLAAV